MNLPVASNPLDCRICTPANSTHASTFISETIQRGIMANFNGESIMRNMEQSEADLLQTIAGFSQEEFNMIPFEGSWTAGQVAEHLLKSESGLPILLKGKRRTADRPVDEKMNEIESIFLDFNAKYQSPILFFPLIKPKKKKACSPPLL